MIDGPVNNIYPLIMLNNILIKPKKTRYLKFGFVLSPDRTYPAEIVNGMYQITLDKNVYVCLEKKDVNVVSNWQSKE